VVCVWRSRCQDLLHFLGAGELEEDGRTFDGGAAFKVVSCGPRGGSVVLCWTVEVAEVDDCYFILC